MQPERNQCGLNGSRLEARSHRDLLAELCYSLVQCSRNAERFFDTYTKGHYEHFQGVHADCNGLGFSHDLHNDCHHCACSDDASQRRGPEHDAVVRLFGRLHRSSPRQQYHLVGHDYTRPDPELMQGAFEMKKLLTSLFAFLFAVMVPVASVATTVSPVVLDLQTSGRRVVSNISVTNTSAGPMTMEITVTPLKPIPTGFAPAGPPDSDEDMLVTPPSALIPAGKTQTFRVQWVGDPEMTQSKHYYVGVNQLPVKLPEGQSAVQIVYNFNVLVSVSSPDQKPQLAITSVAPATVDGKVVAAVTVHNGGTAHDYISQHKLKITETNASGVELASKTISGSEFQQLVGYGIVASGQTRTVDVPLEGPIPAGARLSAVFTDERAQ